MGVLLEGLEVVFIVLTFGTTQGNIPLAAVAAAAAIVVIVALGVAVRVPLSKVPENTLKYVVGLLLTTFGLFWVVRVPAPSGLRATARSSCCWRSSPSSQPESCSFSSAASRHRPRQLSARALLRS